MAKCRRAGVQTPTVYMIDQIKYYIYMERIIGQTIKEFLRDSTKTEEEKICVSKTIGDIIGKMHNADIVHGDLTTSNIMISNENQLYLIDFGLGMMKPSVEDKGVDLYVLERAFYSTHPGSEHLVISIKLLSNI